MLEFYLLLVGLVAAFIDSSLGMGYGVSSVAVLISFGISPAIASASVHTVEGFVDIFSGISHLKLGNVEKHLLFPLVIPGIFGAILGAFFLSSVSTKTAKPLVSLILLGMGMIILFRSLRKRIYIKTKLPYRLVPLLGFAAAFIDVTGGGGWGPLATPTFILGGSEPRKAVGTVEFAEPFISFTATLTFAYLLGFETFMLSIMVPLLIGGLILTPIAAYICKKIPARLLGILVGIWITLLSARNLL